MRGRAGQVATLVRLRRQQAERRRVPVEERLRRLIDHARARSPHYRRVLAGLEGAPLEALPVLTKADLVDRFDELVTDPALRGGVSLESPPRGYRLAVSSGSTGRPATVAFDADEWAGLLAASASMRQLAGPPPGPRAAKVGSPSPWHLSAQLGATLQDPRRPTLRLPVTTPLDELVGAIDGFRPDILTAYPSILALLTDRLAVRPRQVFGGGEVLSAATRRRVGEAWGTQPFDQYVTTEAGPIAGECAAHHGMHVLTDHVILEVLDETVLVTVLSSRTIPLLRYELADRVELATDDCPCGRRGPRVAAIAGRARDVLRIGGSVVHPTGLTAVLDTAAVAAWQVVQRGDHLRVLVVGPAAGFDDDALRAGVAGAAPGATVDVEVVEALPSGAAGKAERFVVSGGR